MTRVPTTTGFDPVRLIEQHQTGVWRYLRALGCDPAEADDLTQETFLAVLQKPFEDYNRSATAGYLRKVAHNLFITVRRRAGRVVPVAEIEQVETVWERWAGQDNGDATLGFLRECLGQLTQRARWALEMRFRDHLPRQEIAAELKITEHGAKNLMQRAKKQLRGCIERKMRQ